MPGLALFFLLLAFISKAQQEDCTFKKPFITIHFGSGQIDDITTVASRYERVPGYCPTDGHYTYTPNTSDCFRGDWFTLDEDHTAGDKNGNMLLVNSSYFGGAFFSTSVKALKPNTIYEFGVWIMNVCRISEKCPFPLLPDITINIRTAEGKLVSQLNTGEVERHHEPSWQQYRFTFTTPKTASDLSIVMINNNPGGCGNDFAMDDITFRECIVPPPVKKITKTPQAKRQLASVIPPIKKTTKPAPKKPVTVTKKPVSTPRTVQKPAIDSVKDSPPVAARKPVVLPPAPAILRSRANTLIKSIKLDAGEIHVNLYDNGEIDGDTVTIYHNNVLLVRRARLSAKAITFSIPIDASHPHHELTMVAENLGSIPPNTSLMIVTSGEVRHEVFISSTKQKNAKVVFDLR